MGSHDMCDLNRAKVDEIAALDGLDRARALELLLWRPYASWQEVESVPGMDARIVARLQRAGAKLSRPRLPDWRPPIQPYSW